MKTVSLREISHCRAGEKIDSVNISVICYRESDYAIIEKQVTVEAVRKVFSPITQGAIMRYEVPNIGALNFVLDGILDGGRTRTCAFEESGKALSTLMYLVNITVPDDYPERSKV
ncbi:MAG: hypothetical protein RBR15_09485 [Sphaerochaeta sp.]|nr:hypothetical protein [Sphaerochaeta sp.]